MDYTPLIISTLWSILSIIMFMSAAPYCKDLKRSEKIIVCCIFIIGGPAFAISYILQALLDTILPEGWDNEDDFKGY